MSKILLRFDLFLLRGFQSAADWIMDIFGIGNFQIAKLLMAIVYSLLLIWDCSICFSLYKLYGLPVSWLIKELLGILILLVWWNGIIINAEKSTEKNHTGTAGPHVFLLAYLRAWKILYLLMSLPELVEGIDIITDRSWQLKEHYHGLYHVCNYSEKIASFLIVYFTSCQPKPKGTGKIKAWLNRYKLVMKPSYSN